MNACGSCRMCCKILGVETIKKPCGTMCQHADKKVGCRIYESRPEECRTFSCMWVSRNDAGVELDPELEPTKCRAVIYMTQDQEIVIALDAWRTPDWTSGAIGRFLAIASDKVTCFVTINGEPVARYNPKNPLLKPSQALVMFKEPA